MQKLIPYSKNILNNGLPILMASQKGRQMAVIHFFTRCGSRFENTQENGYSHFLEHILLKGPNKAGKEDAFYEELESLGAYLNGHTFPEFTYLIVELPKSNTSQGLNILADTLLNPRFIEEEIENEKKVITEEINQFLTKNEEPSNAWDAMVQLLWPEHPLGRNVLGKKEVVASITPQKLKKFKNNYYFAKNSNLVISGDISWQNIQSAISKFNKLPPGKKAVIPMPAPSKLNNANRLRFIEKQELSAQVLVAFPTISYKHKSLAVQDVLAASLAEGWGSELFKRIRRQLGLVYNIWDESTHYEDAGFLGMGFQCSPENLTNIIREIMNLLKTVEKQGLSMANLERAKALLAGELLSDTDKLTNINYLLGRRNLYDYYQDPAKEIKKIKTVSNSDIKAFMKKFVNKKNLYISYVGPEAKKQRNQVLSILKKPL